MCDKHISDNDQNIEFMLVVKNLTQVAVCVCVGEGGVVWGGGIKPLVEDFCCLISRTGFLLGA